MEERWNEAVEAVVYELARHNGESPLDRGAALRRRVTELAGDLGLACAFDQLAAERRWHREERGEESESRVRARMYRAAFTATLMAA
ncbi:hypothetical protein OJ997_00110 [Solirubrobacter phytolaccae]|uniref:Uncharacterized protein n=1 Tax=Solirubrobacter phytolaccae TaxID=1404360 RepID=A0A9X3N572_9ACTN|nr:hypothetical protein [Solirubrobacter phytolaccae]MDA0178680.1 hypothetical protein [Solirubrobacter phytolaccae]